ncbi:MAG: VCBS repeat-containing protein [Akkermansiaceae bacterium]
MNIRWLLFFTAITAVSGEVTITPLPPATTDLGNTLFQKHSSQSTGINFVNQVDESHPLARLYFSGFASGSVVMADFNGDRRQDLFFTGGAGKNGLFLQKETPLQFTNATKDSGLLTEHWNSGSAAADLDQDGDTDLIICAYDQPVQIFINNGSGKFTAIDLTGKDAFLMPTLADYDRDGDLDLFILTNQLYHQGGRPADPPVEKTNDGKLRVKKEFERYYGIKRDSKGKLQIDNIGRPNYLFRNDSQNGQLKFTDVTQESGLTKLGFGLSATWFDFNQDGWPDLHIGNDFIDPDRLWVNQCDGTFKDAARTAFPTCAWFSMGADAADIDGDGLEDLFCADMAFTTHYKQKVGMGQMGAKQAQLERIKPLQVMRNHLFLNSGFNRFREAAQLAGLGKSNWTWAVKFSDLNLDGHLDLFVTNGAIRSFNHADYDPDITPGTTNWDRWKDTPSRPEANLVFQNLGDYQFKNQPDWGLGETNISHGLACGDLDGDGDPDLVTTNVGSEISIFENHAKNPRLSITLNSPVTEGAVLQLNNQRKTIRTAGGYYTTAPPTQHFALASSISADLKITWPDASEQTVPNLKSGNHYSITKDSKIGDAPQRPLAHFGPPRIFKKIKHEEKIFDDFARQPLLPHKLSQLGPGTAVGDIDGDGDLDFFLGGASGKPDRLFRNTGKGLEEIQAKEIGVSFLEESTAAAFFDADSDGDEDLFVGRAHYEFSAASNGDQLFLNNGSGQFTASQNFSKFKDFRSCVKPCDFDLDGDLDLFLGSRVKAGQYPLSTPSRILRNDHGTFTEISFDDEHQQMVTDAVWVDLNGDRYPELITVSEWAAPVLYQNTKGKLTRDLKSGLHHLTGWWTRIRSADIDRDGDLDLAIGNFGLNTKYHASPKKPALLYYGTVGTSDKKQIIEAEYEDNTLFPIRGKSCSTAAMPNLAKKFDTYHAFALAELNEIYNLKEAQRFDAKFLESGFLINDGTGKLTFRPMPRIAQLSPIQGLVFSDLTGNGSPDLIISQNFLNPQFETGPYSGGFGLMLKNDGQGNFTALEPRESGILLPGDPRGLHLFDITGDQLPDLLCPLNNGPLIWQKRTKK